MDIKAKFTVNGVTKRKGWDGKNPWVYDITLNPVVSGSEENQRFYAATPNGEIKLITVNESAANTFEPGAEYYVNFEKA